MSWQQTEPRHGRTVVFLLVAAIFVVTALAIALVSGAASQGSRSGGVIGGGPVTSSPGGNSNLVIARHRTTSTDPSGRIGDPPPGRQIPVDDATGFSI